MITHNPIINSYIEKYLNLTLRSEMTNDELKWLLMWTYTDQEGPLFKSILNFSKDRIEDYSGIPNQIISLLENPINFVNISFSQFDRLIKNDTELSDRNLYDIFYNAFINNKYEILSLFLNKLNPSKEWILKIIELITNNRFEIQEFKICDVRILEILLDYIGYLPTSYIENEFISSSSKNCLSEDKFYLIVKTINNSRGFSEKRLILLCSGLEPKRRNYIIEMFSDKFPKIKTNCYGHIGVQGKIGHCEYIDTFNLLFVENHPFYLKS